MSDAELSTFNEALAYLRPHKLTNGDAPVILKAGMLRCCVSAILMREADLLSRLTAAEAGREEACQERDDARCVGEANARAADANLAASETAEAARDAALARVEKLEKALSDPIAVHVNMLRGSIARPSIESIIHLYGVDAIRSALTEAQPKGDQ